MPTSTTTEPFRNRFALSPAEAAEALGITRQTVYNLMKRGELRSTSIGSSRRIPVTEIERLAGIESKAGDAA